MGKANRANHPGFALTSENTTWSGRMLSCFPVPLNPAWLPEALLSCTGGGKTSLRLLDSILLSISVITLVIVKHPGRNLHLHDIASYSAISDRFHPCELDHSDDEEKAGY
jgi:hypothetical protein